jgi:hypothetical protein
LDGVEEGEETGQSTSMLTQAALCALQRHCGGSWSSESVFCASKISQNGQIGPTWQAVNRLGGLLERIVLFGRGCIVWKSGARLMGLAP